MIFSGLPSLIYAGGDEVTDFEDIYKTYFTDVFRYLRSLCSDELLAEEITAQTFFKALRSADKFRGDCDIRVWLFTIAKNTYFSYAGKQGKISHEPPDDGRDSGYTGCEIELENKERTLEIHRVLHRLPEPYKEVFSLRVFGELSFGEIGSLFGKTAHWACVTYHRAKDKIVSEISS